jgi:hypothetical protein
MLWKKRNNKLNTNLVITNVVTCEIIWIHEEPTVLVFLNYFRIRIYAMSCLFEEKLDLCLKNPPPLFTGKSFIFVSRNLTFIHWRSFISDSRKLTCTYSLEKGSSLFDKMSPNLAPTNTKIVFMNESPVVIYGFLSPWGTKIVGQVSITCSSIDEN